MTATALIGTCHNCSHHHDNHTREGRCVSPSCDCPAYRGITPSNVREIFSGAHCLRDECPNFKRERPDIPGLPRGNGGYVATCEALTGTGTCPVLAPPPPVNLKPPAQEFEPGRGPCAKCEHSKALHTGGPERYCLAKGCPCLVYQPPISPTVPETKIQSTDTLTWEMEVEADRRVTEQFAIRRVFDDGDACRTCECLIATPGGNRLCGILTGDAPADSVCPGTIPKADALPVRPCCDDYCMSMPWVGVIHHNLGCINKTEPGCKCCNAADTKSTETKIVAVMGVEPMFVVAPRWLCLDTALQLYEDYNDAVIGFGEWLIKTFIAVRKATPEEAEFTK